jgi:hypothetical protein
VETPVETPVKTPNAILQCLADNPTMSRRCLPQPTRTCIPAPLKNLIIAAA